MAKKNSGSNANDFGTSAPTQPKPGRRMTGRQPASRDLEPVGARIDAGPVAAGELGRQEPAAHVAQDFNRALQTGPHDTTPSEPSEHDIRVRAYLRYLDRGAFDGADFDDWLQAEMELKKQ